MCWIHSYCVTVCCYSNCILSTNCDHVQAWWYKYYFHLHTFDAKCYLCSSDVKFVVPLGCVSVGDVRSISKSDSSPSRGLMVILLPSKGICDVAKASFSLRESSPL